MGRCMRVDHSSVRYVYKTSWYQDLTNLPWIFGSYLRCVNIICLLESHDVNTFAVCIRILFILNTACI